MATVDNLEINVTANSAGAEKGVSKLTESIKKLSNSSKKLKKVDTAFSKLARSVMRIGFYRLVRSAIKGITDGIKEGTKNLYLYSDALGGKFSGALDTASTAMQYLKNGFATAFAPLVELVVPYLDAAIDKIVELMNSINQVVAYLRGEDTFTRAVKVAKKYSDSLDGVKDSADRAKRSLLGFDEINRLSENNANGKNTADPSIMFEEQAIGDVAGKPLTRFMETLKKIKDTIAFLFGQIKDIAKDMANDLGKLLGYVGLSIGDFAAIALTGIGLLMALFGGVTGNIPMVLKGLGLAAIGLVLGDANGTWEKLFGAVAHPILKYTPLLLVGIGLATALIGALTHNPALLLAGLGIAGTGIVLGNSAGTWKELFGEATMNVLTSKAVLLTGIGLIAALFGWATRNPILGISGLALTAYGIYEGVKEGTWKELFGDITGNVIHAKNVLLTGIGLIVGLFGFLTCNPAAAASGLALTMYGIVAGTNEGTWDAMFNHLNSLMDDAEPGIKGMIKLLRDLAGWLKNAGESFNLVGGLFDFVGSEIKRWWTEDVLGKPYDVGESIRPPLSSQDSGSSSMSRPLGFPNNSSSNSTRSWLDEIKKKNNSNVRAYAGGGFPEDGLFFANHNELVGQFSNGKTAVANNAQIIDGIKEGVYEAVFAAMNNSNSGGDIIVKTYLDGKQVAETTTRRQWERQRAMGV